MEGNLVYHREPSLELGPAENPPKSKGCGHEQREPRRSAQSFQLLEEHVFVHQPCELVPCIVQPSL